MFVATITAIMVLLPLKVFSESDLYMLKGSVRVQIEDRNERILNTRWKRIVPEFFDSGRHEQIEVLFAQRVPHRDRIHIYPYLSLREWDYLRRRPEYFNTVAMKIHCRNEENEIVFQHVHVFKKDFNDPEIFIPLEYGDSLQIPYEEPLMEDDCQGDFGASYTYTRRFRGSDQSSDDFSSLEYNEEEVDLQNIDAKDNNGRTLLFHAILDSDLEKISFLLKNGANPDIGDKYGYLPLTKSIAAGNLEVARQLIFYKADVNLPDRSGRNALHMAADYNRESIIEDLLESGADPDKFRRSIRKETALMIAIRRGHVNVAKKLMSVSR